MSMPSSLHPDEFATLLAATPKYLRTWGRRDAIRRWLGRIVSAKKGYSNLQRPSVLGIVVEVGPAGWLTIVWEDGKINAKWHRTELELIHGPTNWDFSEILCHHPTAHGEILKMLQTMDRSRLWRNGDVIKE